MSGRLFDGIATLDERLVALLLALAFALAAFEGWHLVLRRPYQDYRALAAAVEDLAKARDAAPSAQPDPDRLEAEVADAVRRLDAALGTAAGDAEATALLMAQLDRVAKGHDVVLTGIRPGVRRAAGALDELAFDVSAEGAYVALCRWLLEITGESRSVSAHGFEMRAIDDEGRVSLTLKMVVYSRRDGGAPS